MQKIKTKTSKLGRPYLLDGKRGGYRGGGRKQLFKNGKRFHTIIPKPYYDYAQKKGKNNRLAFQALVEDSRKVALLENYYRHEGYAGKAKMDAILEVMGYKPL